MDNSVKKESGAITVFVSLLLVSILTFGTVMIEAGRYYTAKAQLAEVNISSAQSVLSEYNTVLYQRYGILAYALDNKTKSKFQEYIHFDSDLDKSYMGNNATCLYNIKNAQASGFYNLTYPSVLKRQILSKSKYLRSTYSFAMNSNNMTNVISSFNTKAQAALNSLGSAVSGSQSAEAGYIDALRFVEAHFENKTPYDINYNSSLSPATCALLPSKTGVIKDVVKAEEVESIQATLDDAKKVVPNYASSIGNISAANEDVESDAGVTISASTVRDKMKKSSVSGANGLATVARSAISSMNGLFFQLAANGDEGEKNLLLNSYLARHLPNRAYAPDGFSGAKGTASSENFVMSYAEYLFAGGAGERDNQQAAYWMMFFVRLCDNLNCLLKNYSGYGNNATKILWAYYESLVDMELLTDYKESVVVPLNKTKLFLPINNLNVLKSITRQSDLTEVLASSLSTKVTMPANTFDTTKVHEYRSCAGSDYGAYSDYIAMSLWFVSNQKKLSRLSDLIQLEMRYSEKQLTNTTTFRSANLYTYCRVETNAQFRTLLPVISVDNEGRAFSKSEFSNIRYVGF